MTGETIPALVRRILDENNWTLRDLAQHMGVRSHATVGAWLKGTPPNTDNCVRLAALGRVEAAPVLRAAGHLSWEVEEADSDGIIPSVAYELQKMTPDEQARYALRAIRLARQLAQESRENSQ